ncbi:MAG: hypothetical protein ACJ762_10045 [Solirubrobacteraceae bacterium]
MTTPRRALALLLLAPAFALGACGGGDSDSDKITDIVKSVDKDPSALCDNATDKLLKQVGGTVDSCKEQARAYGDADNDPIKGDIDVSVNGDSATAKFTTEKGKATTANFVKDGDNWKIDSTS